MSIEKKIHELEGILDRIRSDHPGTVALAIIRTDKQKVSVWSGRKTAMTAYIGRATASMMDGQAIAEVTDGFAQKTGKHFRMQRIAWTMEDEDGRRIEHVAVRVDYRSIFVLGMLFEPRTSEGTRDIVEDVTVSELRQELQMTATASRPDIEIM